MFEITQRGAVHVLTGSQPLTTAHLEEVSNLCGECLENGQPRLVFDLSGIPLMDSAGLELLLDMRDDCQKRGGAMQICSPNPLCRDILVATGLTAQFAVFDDQSSAVGSYSR
jgi:anti-sigma B factor antagonist